MAIMLILAYLFIGITVYALTDTRAMASEIESRNWLVTFGEANRTLTFLAIFLWPLWLVLNFFLKKHMSG